MDDSDDALDLGTKPNADLQQSGPFRQRHVDPCGELIPEHPIFGLQILYDLDQLFLGDSSSRYVTFRTYPRTSIQVYTYGSM
jgi:hypothetical protein